MWQSVPRTHALRIGQHHRIAAVPQKRHQRPVFRTSKRIIAASNSPTPQKDPAGQGIGLKALWYGAEAFGNLLGRRTSKAKATDRKKQISREEAIEAIRADFRTNYFVSGEGDLSAYDQDCYFCDPFTGFRGVERFKTNVSNLGALTEEAKVTITDWEERPDSVKTRWRFSAILQLPWRPRLAAAGATTFFFDDVTGLVIRHQEEWDVEPSKVIKQLLKPARTPQNQIETLFENFHRGKFAAAWAVVSPQALIISSASIGILLLSKALGTDEALPGWVTTPFALVSYATFAAAVISEGRKLIEMFDGSGGGGEM